MPQHILLFRKIILCSGDTEYTNVYVNYENHLSIHGRIEVKTCNSANKMGSWDTWLNCSINID